MLFLTNLCVYPAWGTVLVGRLFSAPLRLHYQGDLVSDWTHKLPVSFRARYHLI